MAERDDKAQPGSTPPDADAPRHAVTPVHDEIGPSPEDERVAELLAHSIDVPTLAMAVEQQEAADAADTLEHLDEDEAADVLVAMEDSAAAEALAEMEAPLAAGVIDDLLDEDQVAYAGRLLGLMASDDAADTLQSIDEDRRERIYRALPAETVLGLRRLVGYEEDTAAGLMTTDILAVREAMSVGEATEAIRETEIPDELHHLPVVNDDGCLVGIVGLRGLLLSRPAQSIAEVMEPSVKAIRADLDQEAVAREFDRYDFFMLPVVDEDDRLLGIITVDDVIDIIRVEQTEDVQKTVGAGAGEAVYSGLGEKFRGRFPWLITSLFLTCGAAIVVLFFEELIRTYPIVAFLMPVIAALVGNAGHQALAVTLRGIVLDEVRRERVWPLVTREATVGLLNGCGLGLLMFLVVLVLSRFTASATWQVGAVAGIALAVSMCAGTLAGSAIPLIMRRLGADPAQSSAIFLIMVTDALSFATFLGLVELAYSLLGAGQTLV
jgi:magnesium transporter